MIFGNDNQAKRKMKLQFNILILILIAIYCSFVGIGLHTAYEAKVIVFPWIVLMIVFVIFSPLCNRGFFREAFLFLDKYYWLWMGVAILLVFSVALFGYQHNGAMRSFGNSQFQVNIGLWSLVLAIIFFDKLQSKRFLNWKEIIVIVALLFLYGMLLFQLPYFYAVCLFLIILCGYAITFFRDLRYVLLTGATLFFIWFCLIIFIEDYSFARMNYTWMFSNINPLDYGYQLLQVQKAFMEAGLWGVNIEKIDNMLVKHVDLNHMVLPLLSYLKGNLLTFFIVVLLSIFTCLIYKSIAYLQKDKQGIMSGILALWIINHLVALFSILGFLPLVGHFGVAFLSLSDMSLLAVMMIVCLVIWAEPSEITEKQCVIK